MQVPASIRLPCKCHSLPTSPVYQQIKLRIPHNYAHRKPIVLGIDTFSRYQYFSIPRFDTKFRYRYFSISDHDTRFKNRYFSIPKFRYQSQVSIPKYRYPLQYFSIPLKYVKFIQAISAKQI